MLRIAICDDEKKDRETIEHAAQAFFRSAGLDVEIRTFASAKSLLLDPAPCDLYLLDVLMPEKDGIYTARDIRQKHPDAVIVFITSMIESAVDSYRVEAAGFLLKPVTEAAFAETMERLMRHGRLGPETSLRIMYEHTPVDIPLRRLVVLESNLHRVHIRVDGRVYTISQRLKDLEAQLNNRGDFIRCHQSFIVNLAYVGQLEGSSFILKENVDAGIKVVPISRAYLKSCKKAFFDYRLKGKSGD